MANGVFRTRMPENEPVLSYAPGTPERADLQEALDFHQAIVADADPRPRAVDDANILDHTPVGGKPQVDPVVAPPLRHPIANLDVVGTTLEVEIVSRGRGDVGFGALSMRQGRRRYGHEGPPPSPELSDDDRRYVADYYDAEIAEVDAGIGEVIDAIKASGQWDRTIICLIADATRG